MKLDHVDLVDIDKSVPYSECHFDSSRPVEPSLGGNAYIAHFIEIMSSIYEAKKLHESRG